MWASLLNAPNVHWRRVIVEVASVAGFGRLGAAVAHRRPAHVAFVAFRGFPARVAGAVPTKRRLLCRTIAVDPVVWRRRRVVWPAKLPARAPPVLVRVPRDVDAARTDAVWSIVPAVLHPVDLEVVAATWRAQRTTVASGEPRLGVERRDPERESARHVANGALGVPVVVVWPPRRGHASSCAIRGVESTD